MRTGLSVNRRAWQLLDMMLEATDFYGVEVQKTSAGTLVVDAGIKARGGLEAGRLVTEMCMGGLGKAEIVCRNYGDFELPSILVRTDHPVIATLGSQYAGWQISEGNYFAIGSGPARALALKPKEIYDEIGYKDDYYRAVVILETEKAPPDKLVERFARDSHVSPENLAIVLAPTTSVAGATQVSGRIVETGIHKLRRLGLNPNTIRYAWGVAPIAPVHPKFVNAMARTNDAILYGGTSYYAVGFENDAELKEIVERAPSSASKDYGKPFADVFKEVDYDFYRVDPNLFAPAKLIVNNLKTGKVLETGKINSEVLLKSLGF